jgi:hypothetical protein
VWAGDPAKLPSLIQTLRGAPEVTTHPAFEQVKAEIHQQQAPCEATFAVTPYLVELLGKTRDADRSELLIQIGFIAATEVQMIAPDEFRAAFEESLAAAERLCIQHLLRTDCDLPTAYYLATACLALARHPLGQLMLDNYWPHLNAETYAVCPTCTRRVGVAAFDTGLVVETSSRNPYPAAPPSGTPPEPPEPPDEDESRKPNPWEPLAAVIQISAARVSLTAGLAPHYDAAAALSANGLTTEANPSAAFSLMGAMLAVKGYAAHAPRYFHSSDHIACPNCKTRFRFADRWWRLPL